jgi:hypothetical protein
MTQSALLAVRRDPRRLFTPLALLLLLGCGHTEPFASPPTDTDRPFDPTPPVRLTLNQGPDRGAAWLPDGSGILYSAQQLGRIDHDICLALIPPGGGTQRRLTCDLTPTGADSTDALESPAPFSDGRLAFVTVGSRIDAITPPGAAIVVAAVTDPADRTRVQSLPYTAPGERLHSGASQIRWLNSSRLIFLAERVDYHLRCYICVEWDTITTGVDIALLDLTQPGTLPHRIPGTDFASGVSVGGSEDDIYYSLNGDSRVYRQTLSTGAVAVAHDFGPGEAVRDVHVVGNRMAAVVGGRLAYGIDPTFGPTSWDSGGVLHLVDLDGGADVILDPLGLYRRPQISPSGSAVVAEGYPLIITDVPDGSGGVRPDTTVSRRGDLFLFGQQ